MPVGADPPKLSYAQMVQRTKEREAELRAKQGDTPDTTQSKDSTSAKDASANVTSRPAALREQQPGGSRLPPRPSDHMHKDRDRDDPRDQRMIGGRRAKENRDRRGDRDRDRDRFRDRRRDREADARSHVK